MKRTQKEIAMSTMTQTVPDPKATPRVKAEKGSKSYSVSLDGPAGELRLVAQRRGDGAVAYAVLKATGKKKGERGITTKHRDLDAARAAVEKMAVDATGKLGWKRRERKAGFTAAPDSFSVLPAANAVPATTTAATKTTKKK